MGETKGLSAPTPIWRGEKSKKRAQRRRKVCLFKEGTH